MTSDAVELLLMVCGAGAAVCPMLYRSRMHPAELEIKELHDFFEKWYDQAVAEGAIVRLEEALHGEYSMVFPDGTERDRAATIDAVRTHRDVGAVTIIVNDISVLYEDDDVVLASYLETQQRLDGGDRRRSTVVFLKDPDGPNGLRWLRVHETKLE